MNNDTFSEQIRDNMTGMYRLAYGILGSAADAEDAVSEAILRAYENRGRLRKAEAFRPWIMQITANEARRSYRRASRSVTAENMEELLPSFRDDYHELWDVVGKLELKYREVILLFYYEQFSIREIATVLHIPEGTVKSRLARGKQQLREML